MREWMKEQLEQLFWVPYECTNGKTCTASISVPLTERETLYYEARDWIALIAYFFPDLSCLFQPLLSYDSVDTLLRPHFVELVLLIFPQAQFAIAVLWFGSVMWFWSKYPNFLNMLFTKFKEQFWCRQDRNLQKKLNQNSSNFSDWKRGDLDWI